MPHIREWEQGGHIEFNPVMTEYTESVNKTVLKSDYLLKVNPSALEYDSKPFGLLERSMKRRKNMAKQNIYMMTSCSRI